MKQYNYKKGNLKHKQMLFVFLASSIIFFSCSKSKLSTAFEEYTGPTTEIIGIDGMFSDSAVLKLKFSSPKLVKHKNENDEYPDGLYIESFKDSLKESTLKADYGIKLNEEDYWRLKGNVVMKNLAKNQQMNTEEIYWKPSENRIWSEVKVKITTPDQILTGTGLTALDDFSEYEMLKPESIILFDTEE